MKRTKKITRAPQSQPHFFPPAKLSVGQLNNFFLPKLASGSKLQRKCRNCEDEQTLHRKEHLSQPANKGSEMPSYIESLSSKGSPLTKEEKSFFEPRFSYDFSGIKIHNDGEATKSAQSINALAYTIGNNIVFNQDQFSPQSNSGKKLLAHELTHVVQQKARSNVKRNMVQRMSVSSVGGAVDDPCGDLGRNHVAGLWKPGNAGGVAPSGNLPSIDKQSGWWRQHTEGPSTRHIMADWRCCNDKNDYNVIKASV